MSFKISVNEKPIFVDPPLNKNLIYCLTDVNVNIFENILIVNNVKTTPYNVLKSPKIKIMKNNCYIKVNFEKDIIQFVRKSS